MNYPRVTPADVSNAISDIRFFTAAEGVIGASASRNEDPSQFPAALSLLTLCVLTLENGFTVTGKSACADPRNFDPEVGKNLAFEAAKEEIWPLLGFRLRDKISSGTVHQND